MTGEPDEEIEDAGAPPKGSATLVIDYGYDVAEITLTPDNWERVKARKPLKVRSKDQLCDEDGHSRWVYWWFFRNEGIELLITQGRGRMRSSCSKAHWMTRSQLNTDEFRWVADLLRHRIEIDRFRFTWAGYIET